MAVVAAPGGGMDLVWDIVGWLNHRFKKATSSRAQVLVVLSQRPTRYSEVCDNIHSPLPKATPVWVLCLCHMARKSLAIPSLASTFLNQECQQRV